MIQFWLLDITVFCCTLNATLISVSNLQVCTRTQLHQELNYFVVMREKPQTPFQYLKFGSNSFMYQFVPWS